MNEPLRTTLVDAVGFLDRHHVPYAVIGGIAVSLRGEPRVTADVDIVIATDVAGALQLLDAIQPTPFEPLFQGVEEVVEQAFILPLRHTASGVKLDIAVGLSGFERQAIARATPVDFGEFSVAIATAEDLLIMKVLASRPRDVRFTPKTWNLTTHRIDPDVDEARDYVVDYLVAANRVSGFGYIAGVEATTAAAPRHNLTGDPYFTDGNRAVLILSRTDTQAAFLDWS